MTSEPRERSDHFRTDFTVPVWNRRQRGSAAEGAPMVVAGEDVIAAGRSQEASTRAARPVPGLCSTSLRGQRPRCVDGSISRGGQLCRTARDASPMDNDIAVCDKSSDQTGGVLSPSKARSMVRLGGRRDRECPARQASSLQCHIS